MNFSKLSKTGPLVRDNQEKTTKTIKLLYKSLINELSKYSSSLKTKLDNINKAGVDKCIPCTTKRVSQNSRTCIKYKLIKKNNLNLSALKTYLKGICVLLNWKEYQELKDKQNRDELDEYLFNNIGSDNTVSCIICIMKSDGYSGSNNEREEKLKLDEEANELNWFPIRRKESIKQPKNINEGNDKWEGHYHYEISGGKHESLKSWEGEEQPQIFTTHKGFMATQNVIDAVFISLIYMLIHVHDIGKAIDENKVEQYKSEFELYLKTNIYLNKSCYDSIIDLKCFDKQKHLISPILCKKISIDDFCEEHKLNISHNIAVSKNIILFCDTNDVLLSDYHPGNLFWDFKIANMRQQDDTIEEYWKAIRESLELRNDLY